jgi:hypothetical protein
VGEARALAAATACRDACRVAARELESAGKDASGRFELLDHCATHCDAVVSALERGGSVDEQTVTKATSAAFECAHGLGEAPEFHEVVTRCEQLIPLLQELNAPRPAYDKVVADTFPSSDPPAH